MTVEILSQKLSVKPELQHFVEMVEATRQPKIEEDKQLVGKLFQEAEVVVGRMEQIAPNPDVPRTGTIMVVAKDGSDGWVVAREVREIQSDPNRTGEEKRIKYTEFALAKTAILLGHPDLLGSVENKDLSKKEKVLYYDNKTIIPGGGIRIGDYVIAISSFVEDDDESTVLATAVRSDLIDDGRSIEIAHLLENPRYPEIAEELLV